MTAGAVMTKMKPEERFAYMSGVVEGLAYARYVSEGKSSAGMTCIYKWFYQNEATLPKIYSAFDRFGDHTPGAVMAALIQKECGS